MRAIWYYFGKVAVLRTRCAHVRADNAGLQSYQKSFINQNDAEIGRELSKTSAVNTTVLGLG